MKAHSFDYYWPWLITDEKIQKLKEVSQDSAKAKVFDATAEGAKLIKIRTAWYISRV